MKTRRMLTMERRVTKTGLVEVIMVTSSRGRYLGQVPWPGRVPDGVDAPPHVSPGGQATQEQEEPASSGEGHSRLRTGSGVTFKFTPFNLSLNSALQ